MFWVNVEVSQVKLDKQLLASQHIMAWRRLAAVPRACVKAVRAKYNANWPVSWSFGVEFLERMFVCKLTFAHWNLCVFLANKADASDALIWSQRPSRQSQCARSWSTWNLQRAALATRHGYTTEESHPKGSRTFECSKNQSFVFNANGFLILPLQVCFWACPKAKWALAPNSSQAKSSYLRLSCQHWLFNGCSCLEVVSVRVFVQQSLLTWLFEVYETRQLHAQFW